MDNSQGAPQLILRKIAAVYAEINTLLSHLNLDRQPLLLLYWEGVIYSQ